MISNEQLYNDHIKQLAEKLIEACDAHGLTFVFAIGLDKEDMVASVHVTPESHEMLHALTTLLTAFSNIEPDTPETLQ